MTGSCTRCPALRACLERRRHVQGSGNSRFGLFGKRVTGLTAGRNGLKKAEIGEHAPRRYDGPYRLEKRGFADVAGRIRVRASRVEIAQCDRLQDRTRVQRRLEQGSVERLESAPERRSAFGE